MRKVTLVRGARQLLTLRGSSGPRRGAELGNLGLIQDGAVLVVDGLIHQVGPTRRIENLALVRQADEIDASGCVVMPGFVDSHTQLVGGPARMLDFELGLAGASAEQIAEAGGGALAQARAIEDLSPHTLEALARKAIEEAVRHGTTSLETRSGLGITAAGETKILRVQAALKKQLISPVSTFLSARFSPEFENPDSYLDWICSHWLPLVSRRKLADFVEIRCETGSFALPQACRFLTCARQLGFALKIETGLQPVPGAIRLAVELAAASVSHAIGATEQDARLLAESPTIATLLPGAVFFAGTEQYAPARMLIDYGAAVALASGYNPETRSSLNMQMMLAFACKSMHMTPAEVVTAATLNAACALGQASQVGSLEAGKSADLLIFNVSDYREISYHLGSNVMNRVIKNGVLIAERSEVKWPAL